MSSAVLISSIIFSVAVLPCIFADQYLWGNSPMQFGALSEFDNCPYSTYVVAVQIKVEPDQGDGDDTALNSIKFGCDVLNSDPKEKYSNTIKGLEGPFGNWGKWFHCSQGFSGFQLRVERYLGTSADDTAANSLKMLCGSEWIDLDGMYWGDWLPKQSCGDNMVFCGLQTRVEPQVGANDDDTALNDANFKCCTVI